MFKAYEMENGICIEEMMTHIQAELLDLGNLDVGEFVQRLLNSPTAGLEGEICWMFR